MFGDSSWKLSLPIYRPQHVKHSYVIPSASRGTSLMRNASPIGEVFRLRSRSQSLCAHVPMEINHTTCLVCQELRLQSGQIGEGRRVRDCALSDPVSSAGSRCHQLSSQPTT